MTQPGELAALEGEGVMREDADEYRAEEADERRRRRLTWGCLCGYPDMPGRCPGPAACPMHGQFDEDDEAPPPSAAADENDHAR